MIIGKLLNIVGSGPGWDIIKAIDEYLGLKDYLRLLYEEKSGEKNIRNIVGYKNNPNIPGEKIFWRDVFTGTINDNTIVNLKNFQISSWFPRRPGLYWTNNAIKARQLAMEDYVEEIDNNVILFNKYGKVIMTELGGIGSVNFRKDRDEILITATASGFTDRGIPLICSKPVWNRIESAINQHQMIEVDLKGEVDSIPIEYDSYFLRSPLFPKIALRVNSNSNLDIKISEQDIFATPWTIFKTRSTDEPYGFTYVTHNIVKDRIDDTTTWITQYVDNNNGDVILTDFDENLNPLGAIFPLNDCMSGNINIEKIMTYSQEIYRRYQNLV